MKILLKLNLLYNTFLCFLNNKKHIHRKRIANYTLEYYDYSLKMKTKMTIEEVKKLKQKINLLSIYLSPPELKKIHYKINNYLQRK
jgi:hypothetical protein